MKRSILAGAISGLAASLVCFLVFWFATAATAPARGEKPWVITGDRTVVQRIDWTDDAGKVTLSIIAGPPPTIEVKTSSGKMRTLDLSKLASSPFLGLPPAVKEE